MKKRQYNKIEILKRYNVRSHLFCNQYFCVLPLRCFKVIQHMNNVTITPLKSSNMRIVENIIFAKVVLVKTYTKSILFHFLNKFSYQQFERASTIVHLHVKCTARSRYEFLQNKNNELILCSNEVQMYPRMFCFPLNL